jgi:hypothetical protein
MGRLLKKKVAAFVIILILALSIATAYYVTTQDSVPNFAITNTPQPTAMPTSAQSTSTYPPEQTTKPKNTPTEPYTLTFNYSQTNVQYTDSTTIITLKIAFESPPGPNYGIFPNNLYLVSNGTKISDKTIDRSWSGYPLTIDFIITGHFTGDYELRYNDSNATFLYNKV